MTITLTPKTEHLLVQQAQRTGEDINSLADALISDGLSSGTLSVGPDDLTDNEIAEIRVGIGRGLEAAAAGRIMPLAKAVAEARQRHEFPASWASSADGTN